VVGSALAGHALAGRRRQGQGRSRQRAQQVVRQAASGGYLKARERRDGHGWIKEDPEFNPGEASGASVTVELKKRPMGISRYTHGEGGKGAMVVEMTEKARYPGDPRGQCAVGGVKKNMIVKSINGTDVAGWDFSDIMDMLEDTEGDANCTQEAKAAWEARPRNHQAVALPATVTFQECAFSEGASSAPAPQIAGAWYPRGGGFSDAELDAEKAKAASFPVPAGYSGVRYTGPGCLNEAWLRQFAEQQRSGILLPKGDAYALVVDCCKLLKKHKTLNEINVPAGQTIHVVGDTHGQYWDFLHMLSLTGFPSATNPILFNGDFVDRGSWGMEVVLMIYAFKVMCPGSVHLTRGNHEIIAENLLYGFCGETFKKYDGGLFDLFSESFRSLSLCHTINKEVFVMHAGLPGPNPRQWLPGQSHDPEDAIPVNAKCMTLADIAAISRETELQDSSYKNAVGDAADKWAEEERTIIDLVWGDPRGGPGYGPSYRKSKGVFMFGPDVTEQFCRVNGLKAVIRSHEVKQLGWKQDHPQLYTVFSCPDYMDAGGNQGAFLTLENDGSSLSIKPTSFDKTPHPDLKPMVWQEYMMQVNPHLTRKMKKKTGLIYDSNGMIVGEIKDTDQGDSDSGQSMVDEWVEDEDYARA